MAIALKGLLPQEERQSKDFERRTEQAVLDAVERVAEENQEWVVAEGYDDGGPAESMLEKPEDASAATSGHSAYRRGRGGRSVRGVGDQWRGGRGRGNQERGGRGWGSQDRGGCERGYQERGAYSG